MTAQDSADRQDLRWVWLASEVLLVATSVSTVLMLQRIFSDGSFVAPLMFTLIVGHGVLIAMRWFGFGTIMSALASFAGTAVAIIAIHYSASAAAAIIPTSATIEQFRLDMSQAQALFESTTTPVPPITGFLVVASLGLWVIAFAADWAAFRLFAPGQAMIPFIAVLIFVSLLGVDENRLGTTATALVCGVLFLLSHRSASRAAQGVWLDHGPGRGYLSLMTAGAILAVIAAVAGILGGPAVPGANEAPLVELGDESRDQNKPLEVISPLVQIQPRLIDQSDRVLFTVETNQRAYWRIAALDVFDGSLWRSQGQFRSADDALPVDYPSSAPVDTVVSTFDLGELNVVWAPAAYLPTRFENLSGGAGVNYESESATFIVDTNDQTVSDGLRYTVTSQIPNFTADSLRQLAAESTESVDARYLDLPADFSPLARQTAEGLTANLTSPYDKAIALQNYFRDNFTYDVDVAKGHDIERLEDFLTVQRGYCEQFAGTYAAMARSIGLPARVATGFTPGDPDPNNPNLYIVRGKHAHAWPEVFIAGAGWVAFEPTPGRGAPNATEYTGVPESQDSFDSNSDATEGAQSTPPEQAAAQLDAAPTPTPIPPDAAAQPPDASELDATNTEELPDGAGSNALRNAVIAIVLIAAWVFGIPALKRWRTQRRVERIGTDPRRRITLAWASIVDFLESQGQSPFEAETLQEYAERVQRELPKIHPAFGDLTDIAVEAAYRSALPKEEQAERADQLAQEIRRIIESDHPWPVRGVNELDPRPLIKISDPVADLADRLAAGAAAETPV